MLNAMSDMPASEQIEIEPEFVPESEYHRIGREVMSRLGMQFCESSGHKFGMTIDYYDDLMLNYIAKLDNGKCRVACRVDHFEIECWIDATNADKFVAIVNAARWIVANATEVSAC